MSFVGATDCHATKLDDGTLRLEWPVGPAGMLRAEIPRCGPVWIRATTDQGDYLERTCLRHEGVIAATVGDYLHRLGVCEASATDLRARQIAAEVVEACD